MTLRVGVTETFENTPEHIEAGKVAFDKAVQEHIINLTLFNKSVGKPRPVASNPLVEQAIKCVQTPGKPDGYFADYEYVVKRLTLEEKKTHFETKLTEAENAAKYKILPRLKVRLAHLRYDTAIKTPEDKRTSEQNEDIASYELIAKAWSVITLKAAQVHSDIDDLTEATVDSWQTPNLD